MSYVTFDCSQFITFDCGEFKLNKKVAKFEKTGLKVLFEEEINSNKKQYLNPFLHENVIELFDQEFIGIFEDWQEEEYPPPELINLKLEIFEFCKKLNLRSLKLIIISTASENIEEDTIIIKTVHFDQFYTGLFSLSKWNFNEAADNLFLTIHL